MSAGKESRTRGTKYTRKTSKAEIRTHYLAVEGPSILLGPRLAPTPEGARTEGARGQGARCALSHRPAHLSPSAAVSAASVASSRAALSARAGANGSARQRHSPLALPTAAGRETLVSKNSKNKTSVLVC